MTAPPAPTKDVISFGPFRMDPNERLLTKNGAIVDLGARTLDTLMVLVSSPNEIVGKRELMAQVWPDVTVEEGSLRFHISGLRKALGDGENGARYITTLAGRGYCFVAPITRSHNRRGKPAVTASFPRAAVPGHLLRMVGRQDDVLTLARELAASRFVTIVGPGGVGKTTVAAAVAHELLEDFAGAVHFVELGALSDSGLVASSLALSLGLSVRSEDPTPSLISHLHDKRMLLILDNCEHVIDAAATLATKIVMSGPGIHILATSREALRVDGEQVYKLAPLGFPSDDPGLTAAIALTFPATQLFVERAAAGGARLEFDDTNAVIVASICRKLDGVALAIELAAGRVGAYGLSQTAALLEQKLSLLWQGKRSAPPRQQTLKATLDWSFGLLSVLEREVLRQLAVFVGDFTLEAALAVVSSANTDQALIFGALDSLVAKSMIATRPIGAMMRYRLLDTTRAYTREAGIDDADLVTRHAIYYQRWLEQAGAEWPTLSNAAERAPHLAGLSNVRTALEWCFDVNGNTEIGIGLAAAAVPVFLAMSLLTECHRWSERAILALGDTTRGSVDELNLQRALGLSLMFTRGNSEAARVALNRSLVIAEERGDTANQLQLLGRLHMFHHRTGEQEIALSYARRGFAISHTLADPDAIALAHTTVGVSLSYTGELADARAKLEASLRHGPGSRRTSTIFQGSDHYNIAGAYLARTLWLQGYPAQAVARAHQTVEDAAGMDHPVTLSIALMWAASVFLWVGDLQTAEEHVDWAISHAQSHSLLPYLAVGRAHSAELAIRSGDPGGGVEALRTCLKQLHAAYFELQTTALNITLVQGLAATDRHDEAISIIDETIRMAGVNGELSYMPELLRMKGRMFLTKPQLLLDSAEICFVQSLEWSRRQGAVAWELRAAIDLSTLLAARGSVDHARTMLQPILAQFRDGRNTVDIKAGESLLASFA